MIQFTSQTQETPQSTRNVATSHGSALQAGLNESSLNNRPQTVMANSSILNQRGSVKNSSYVQQDVERPSRNVSPAFDDSDDDFLLAASQSVDFTSATTSTQKKPQAVVQPLVPVNRTPQEAQIIGFKKPEVKPTSRNSDIFSNSNSHAHQSSNITYNSTVRDKGDGAAASFDLDLEFEEDFSEEPRAVPSSPFTYLSLFKEAIEKKSHRSQSVVVKAVSATLATKMGTKPDADGTPRWNVGLIINDGSAALRVDLSPDLLDERIGPRSEYVRGSAEQKAGFKERMKALSGQLCSLSALLSLELRPKHSPTVPLLTRIETLQTKHLELLKKRRNL